MAQRPAWFRLSSVMRPPAPAPAPPPAPAPAPAPASYPPPAAPIPTLVRPSIQFRPPLPLNQNLEPTPAPPPPAIPSTAPPPLFTAPPRTSVQNPAPPTPAPPPPAIPSTAPPPSFTALPRTSVQNPAPPPKSPNADPIRSTPLINPAPTEVPPRSPVVTLPPPPLAPAPPRSPSTPPPRSPVSPPASLPRSPIATPPRKVVPSPSPPAPPRSSPVFPATSPPKALAATTQPNSKSPIANFATSTKFPESSPLVPNSPRTKTQSPPMPNSPISKHVSTNSSKVTTLNGKDTSPLANPKPTNPTPAQSPKFNPLARSPSPLTLPPAQINESEPKIEQKSVLVQETIDKPNKTHVLHSSAFPSNGKQEQIKHENGTNKNSQGSGMSVITLAGENKGAVMQLSPANRKNISMGNPHTLNKSNSRAGSSSDDQLSGESGEEGKSRNGGKAKRAMAMQSPPMSAYLNNNVQGVNNSILYNYTSSHNDPGIHLSLNRKANGNRYFKE